MTKSKTNTPPVPPRLTPEAGQWWERILTAFDLDDAGLILLESALESFDRMRQAQAILAKEGIVYVDRFNQPKQHPATMVERDAKATMLRNIKALGLDLEPLHDKPGRPAK
jgi:P27 family predicted phage terminase small subunit